MTNATIEAVNECRAEAAWHRRNGTFDGAVGFENLASALESGALSLREYCGWQGEARVDLIAGWSHERKEARS